VLVARSVRAIELVALTAEISSRRRRSERELARDSQPRDRKRFEVDERRRAVDEIAGRVVIQRRIATGNNPLPVRFVMTQRRRRADRRDRRPDVVVRHGRPAHDRKRIPQRRHQVVGGWRVDDATLPVREATSIWTEPAFGDVDEIDDDDEGGPGQC